MEETKLIATKREKTGSSDMRRLRRAGILPAVIYSEGQPGLTVQVDLHTFEELIHHHGGESMMIDVEVEGEGTFPVLVKDVQHHPVSGGLLHVDLYKVSMDKKFQAEIPIEVIGDAAGVAEGGLVEMQMHSIAVECLPGDLIDAVEIDVTDLKIGDSVTVKDIALDAETYNFLVDDDAIVVSVSAPRVGDDEGGEEGASEPEVIGEKDAE